MSLCMYKMVKSLSLYEQYFFELHQSNYYNRYLSLKYPTIFKKFKLYFHNKKGCCKNTF